VGKYISKLYSEVMRQQTDLAEIAEGLESLVVWLRRLAPNTVSTSTMTTLGTLQAVGPLRISDLAEREAISQPGMTTLVNRLEAAGLAERFADPTDGRASLVRITAAGRRMVADRRAARRDAVLAELERLAPSQCAALAAALPAIETLVAPSIRNQKAAL
jgi:DNA-binding MarR family transcriptional regulator